MDPSKNEPAGVSSDVHEFAAAFAELAREAHRLLPASETIADIVREHLGADPADIPALVELMPAVERPNLQRALDAVAQATDAETRIIGLPPEVRHYPDFSAATLLAGKFRGPGEPVPPTHDELAVDVDETLSCVVAALWLTWHDGTPVVVGAFPAQNHGGPSEQNHRVEIFAKDPAVAQSTSDRLTHLRHELNVYRRKVLSFTFTQYGEFGIDFMPRPQTRAVDVVLPGNQLEAIERHAIGVARHADALREAGQHLKRGLLLYGPPGTGKTHTIGYLMAAMPERTVLVLQGQGIGGLGRAAAIARAFPPAMLVIEDVDLIASDRGMPGAMGSNPFLFQLLNEMDGLGPVDDVLFVLTTNRLEILEPALAARPGRVDQAVEIVHPDAVGREKLLRLYLGDASASIQDMASIVERTDGVTASFFKELVRRATLLALEHDGAPARVTDVHLGDAVTELLDQAAPIMRALLGVEPTSPPQR